MEIRQGRSTSVAIVAKDGWSNVKVLVETDSDELHEEVKADGRGRITLGSEYAGEVVIVAVVKRK